MFDWKHLAHLHDGSFAECNLVDRGPWGWCVDLTPQGWKRQRVELRIDRAAGTYVLTTINGAGTGTEIRVTLDPIPAHVVDVTFEFLLPGPRTERTAELGQSENVTHAIGLVTGMAALCRRLP